MFKKYAIELSNQNQCKVPFLFPLSFFFFLLSTYSLCTGCQQEIACSVSSLFLPFLAGGRWGGGGGWNGGIKTETPSELACSPRGYSRFQITGLIKWGQKSKTQLSLNQKLTTKKIPMPNFQALKISRKESNSCANYC